MARLPRLTALAAAATALVALAAGPASAGDLTLRNPRVLVHFDFSAGQTPESIALEPDGSALVTFAFARQIAHVDPRGDVTVLAELPRVDNPRTPVIGIAAAMGIARAEDGTVYVNYATGTEESGIWRLRPDGSGPVQIARFPATSFPNGLALDEECGTLYAADSARGIVWRVPVTGGTPRAWATGTPLTPKSFVGANGVQVRKGAVWVSNTDRATLLRIPVRPDKSAGPIQTRARNLTWIDDFAFVGHRGDTVLAAQIQVNKVALVRPDGTHRTVLTRADGLANPTSVAVRHRTVYVNSASFFLEQDPDPNLLLARLSPHKG
ncbi:hypothetical protein [Streptomyces sp. enrichment culture]|uniref:hypothetical protein n=1 Tax=Streptomyces sp. enrichment culture TaxID=1795815 RepID=UPI003F54C1DE